MSIYFKQIGLVLLFISAIIFVPLNVQADSIFSVGYLALERPVDEVAVIRPILSALEKLLNKGKEPYHIKSHVVRSKELFKKLISKNTIHFLRCEPILCQELMESDPSLRVIAMETVQGSAKDEFYLVSLLGDEVHDLAGGGRILLGAPGSAAGDFLPRFKLFKEGFKKSDFEYRKGPIYANVVLIDEINRAPAKTQAALFEVMEERQITMDGVTHPMELPFLVVATQNPIEQEGTYRLPEAQLDRFLLKIQIDYPSRDEEVKIITRENNLLTGNKIDDISAVVTGQEIMEFQALVRQVKVDVQMISYIAGIVVNTRENPMLYLGASPRASIALLNASKAHAAIRGEIL